MDQRERNATSDSIPPRIAARCLHAMQPARVWMRNSTMVAIFALLVLSRLPMFMSIMLPYCEEIFRARSRSEACHIFYRYQYWNMTSHTMHGMTAGNCKEDMPTYGYTLAYGEPTTFGWTLFAAFAGTCVCLLLLRLTEPYRSRMQNLDAVLFWIPFIIILVQTAVFPIAAFLQPA